MRGENPQVSGSFSQWMVMPSVGMQRECCSAFMQG